MGKLVVIEYPQYLDVVKTLRQIADEIEAGEFGNTRTGVLALRSDEGSLATFAFGPSSDRYAAAGVFRLAEQDLLNAILLGDPDGDV